MNFFKRVARYSRDFFMRLNHYWGSTRSIDMMWRFLLNEAISVLSFLFRGIDVSIKHRVFKFCNKPILFTTSWGTYLAHTADGWTVTQPNYEEEVRSIIDENIARFEYDKNKVFIDVGSHIGRYVIELSKNYGYHSVAFEPSPETFKMLRVNTILSGVENNVTLINTGLSDHVWEVDFEYCDSYDGSSRVIQLEDKLTKLAQKIAIPVVPFDSLSRIYKTSDVKLILVDVEGYELYALRGMKKFLIELSSGTDMIVEIFENNPARDETINFLVNLGFSAFQINKENWSFKKN